MKFGYDKYGLFRGNGLSTVFARYGLLTAMQRLTPDYIWVVARNVPFKGFSERMAYPRNEPGALGWFYKGSDMTMEEFISYLSNEETRYLLERPASDLVAFPTAKAA